MTSRLVNLLTFGLAARRSPSADGLNSSNTSSAAARRISAALNGDRGDYSSYSNSTVDAFPTDPALSTGHTPSEPTSPDPHEAYILPPSYRSPTHGTSSSSSQSSTSLSPLPHVPSSSASSLTPVLTGDATLDVYKTELDLLSREVDHIRGSISAYARQLIRMGLQATDVAEKAYDVCEASNFFPAGMKVFMKVHRGWSEQAACLFAGQLEEEVLQPLKDWDEKVDQFIRELMRVNQVRLTMIDHKKRFDSLFLRKCDSPKEWTEDAERDLKLTKSNFEATANHYTVRCEGLVSQWKSLAVGRMNALDLLFTRLMIQQYALFQPAIQALTVNGIVEARDTGGAQREVQAGEGPGEVGHGGGGGGGAVGPEASPLTPPTPSGRLRAYSGDGFNVRKRSLDPFDDGDRRAAAMALTHFRPPRMARKMEQERLRKERERREREEEEMDDSDDEDRKDAILRTLELMKEEIREKERIQHEMEQLIAEQTAQKESRKEEESEEASRLRDRLKELELRLEEKEREIARDAATIKEAKEAEEAHDGPVVGADAPPLPPLDGDIPLAPPLDIPLAPPMDGAPPAPPLDGVPLAPDMGDVPSAPPPPGAPSAPAFGPITVKKLTPREKEIAEARKYQLPLLPAVEVGSEVSVKRLHWTVVGGADVKGTVWEELLAPAVDGRDKEAEDWESPLVKKEAGEDESSSDAASGAFEWQWPLGDDFGLIFAQKSAKPMARRGKKKKRRHGAASTTVNEEDDDDLFDEDEEARTLREAAEATLHAQLQRVELVDAKRAYNVSISLSRFRLEYERIRDAVMMMDSEVLSSEMLEVLVDILPTAEEVKLVKDYEGDVALLGDVERFFLCMSVPTLSTRLKSFLFLQSFSSVTSALQDALDSLQRVNERLRESKGLKAVLGLVLRMGNYMTACNGQPQVYGFHLNTLLKLRGVKSVDNKTTLLHFLVHYVAEHCPHVRHFTNDMAGCRAASRVECAFLVAEVKQLQQNVRMVKGLIDEDEKRRGITLRTLEARFNFQSTGTDVADPSAATPLTPLSALSIIPPQPTFDGPQPSTASLLAPTPAAGLSANADSLPPLPEFLYSFYAYARQRVGEIERQLTFIQRQFGELQRVLLWEDSAWESLYGLLAQFVDEWLACEQEQEMQRQAEVRRKRQIEATEALQRRKLEAHARKEKEEAAQLHKRAASNTSNGEEWAEESKGEAEPTSTSLGGESGGSSTPPVFSLELDTVDHEVLLP